MSAFGKLGVGGSLPGKFPGGPNETPVDLVAATTGTEKNSPDSKPEVDPQGGAGHSGL
jgi:hypothetical protein